MSNNITLEEISKKKVYKISRNKDNLTERDYLQELDARISNIEKIFNITIEPEKSAKEDKTVSQTNVKSDIDKTINYYNLNKEEQIQTLLKHGVSPEEINKLTLEEDRVRKLVELEG